jgi:hypothetical protein
VRVGKGRTLVPTKGLCAITAIHKINPNFIVKEFFGSVGFMHDSATEEGSAGIQG